MDFVSLHTGHLDKWVNQHFGAVNLGDKRLNDRVKSMAHEMTSRAGKSLPKIFRENKDLKGTYRLFQHSNATPDALQVSHLKKTRSYLRKAGTYLLIEDTSTLSWLESSTAEASKTGLGPVGSDSANTLGFLLHSTLACEWQSATKDMQRPSVKVLGLADQQYHLRVPRPTNEKMSDSHASLKRRRESELWTKAIERVGPRVGKGAKWIKVADRGSDIYDVMSSCQSSGYDYVLRACHNRKLEDGTKLFDTVRKQREQGSYELEIRKRGNENARLTRLYISWKEVELTSPQRPGSRSGSLASIKTNVVRVYEKPRKEQKKKPIEWILLVSQKIGSLEDAKTCIQQYMTRWLIEEYHKCIKTGMKAEKLQLSDGSRLQAAIAMMTIIALRLLDIRDAFRLYGGSPKKQSGLSQLELNVLEKLAKKKLETVKDVYYALGKLGGHRNRKNDPPPGWQALFDGYYELMWVVKGVELAQSTNICG